MLQKVNEHLIDIPDDMRVVDGGMFDHIEYTSPKAQFPSQILTQEQEKETQVYMGVFFVVFDPDYDGIAHDDSRTVKTLAEARELIDRLAADFAHI